MIFVVDEDNVVHIKRCQFTNGDSQLYVTVPQTVQEMAVHLLRPDSQRTLGSTHVHYGRPILVPCDTCILGIDPDEH